ncbi:hypothetical protein HK104_002768, partial [Borealophlyctis nickersoniae]
MPDTFLDLAVLLAQCLCLALWCLMMLLSVVGAAVIVARHARRTDNVKTANSSTTTSTKQHQSLPGVTILRPLKGVDVDLAENLASSFCQEYDGPFEIIFSVASGDDPAVSVVEELMRRFLTVDARLIVGDIPISVNPKVNNMVRGYEESKYDIIWIMDSNVTVPRTCMQKSVLKLQEPGVGLVHHLPIGTSATTFGSSLENAFLNTAHAKLYVAINFFSLGSCIVGKSNMFRKFDMDVTGGMRQFTKSMSEDNEMGLAIKARGLKHAMTTDLAYQSLGTMSAKAYFDRRARWSRIRAYSVPAATLAEPFSESIASAMGAVFALCGLFGFSAWQVLAVHFGVWVTSDLLIATTVDPSARKHFFRFAASW